MHSQSSKPRQQSSTGQASKALQAHFSRSREGRLLRRQCIARATSAHNPLLQKHLQSALPAWRLWLSSLRALGVCAAS